MTALSGHLRSVLGDHVPVFLAASTPRRGAFVHQVAIGYPNLDHTSLDVSRDGQWLLYLAGATLEVSEGGATPKELTTGIIAAAWV